jgi:hypothetical protein
MSQQLQNKYIFILTSTLRTTITDPDIHRLFYFMKKDYDNLLSISWNSQNVYFTANQRDAIVCYYG